MKVKIKIPEWISEYWIEVKNFFAKLKSTTVLVMVSIVLILLGSIFLVNYISSQDRAEFENIQQQIRAQREMQKLMNPGDNPWDDQTSLGSDIYIVKSLDGESKGEFLLHIADNDIKRSMGLSGWESLNENEGMIFIFNEYVEGAFHMQNMAFDLDIIFLDSNNTILNIFKSIPPCETDPCEKHIPDQIYYSVVEILGGTSENLGLEIGDVFLPVQSIE